MLSDAHSLTVVGLVDNALVNQHEVLAAPGTWERLDPPADQTLSQLTASPTFFFAGQDSASTLPTLVDILAKRNAPGSKDASPSQTLRSFGAAVLTREKAQEREKAPWTSRSPLSFWAPSLLLTPLAVVLGFYGLMRRLGPSVRIMTRTGVKRATAATGAWLAVMVWVASAAIAGTLVGVTVGHVAAQWGSGGWSNPGATWRFPSAGVASVLVGLLLGAVVGWLLLSSRIERVRESANSRKGERRVSPTAVRNVRHGICTLLGCGVLLQLWQLKTPEDGMLLTCLAALEAALLTPDLFAAAVRHLPQRSLTDRLTSRMLSRYSARAAATAALVVLSVAVTVGFLTSLSSAVEGQRRNQETTAQQGQVALDGDDAPALPIAAAVVAATETVPALAQQEPVQLWAVGRLRLDDQQRVVDIADTLGTPELPGITFAFESPRDLSRVLQRPLTASEGKTLEEGGVLVIDDTVRVSDGAVAMVNNTSQQPVGAFPAARSTITRTPWFEAVPAVMLTSTAKQHGLPLSPGAKIYTGVSDGDAQAVLAALSRSGINPENAEIHRTPPPVIPEAALIGSAVGLFALVLLMATSATRSQVMAMRQWASRLTQLGVKRSWARTVMWKQYGWLLLISVPTGLVAGILPLLLTRALVPKILIVVPWAEIAVLLLFLVASVLVASVAASRSMTSAEAIGWRDQGE